MRRISSFVVLLCGFSSALAGLAPCVELNDGNKMPIVALGTGRGTASESASVDEVRQAVYWAIEAGYRHVDTAAIYFDEPEVGQGIRDAINNNLVTREELFVTTKLWGDKHREQDVVPALKESLQKLGLDYVDLYLIHFPVAVKEDGSYDDVDYLETWRGMEKARALGLTRSIGVSNFNASQVDRIIANSRVWPAVNEIEVNPTLTQEALVTHCLELGIAVMGFSPFGFVVSRNNPNAPPPRADDPVLVHLSNKYHKAPTQIILRYLIDRGIVVIPKSVNKKRIEQNIDLFDFSLNDEEVKLINGFNKNHRVIDFADLKDYPNFPYGEY
ncbi:aldo-keto reductase AKR2E4 [Bicyclus anynana]|uniref:Aldo-keto reductase AKR2E4 n=1 Tax=Bicyclus anynana TaxID=110368 RepID=A0A6J1N5C4_BICAN|nr:aldo-keto reductase AKR2E4 [Bicyclus anynana]